MTPRKTELNQPLLSPLTNAKDSWFDKYQQHHLRFTTQQLFDAGVIVDDEAKDNNLEGELFEGFKSVYKITSLLMPASSEGLKC